MALHERWQRTLVTLPFFGFILPAGGVTVHTIAKLSDALLEVLVLDLCRIVLVAAVTTIRTQVIGVAGTTGAGAALAVA